ncbi:MAG TPA: hypothetical protein VK612_12945 [Pyrinomonadaceae bacterium]|nr:hypothetical protein [Pyrinomonadaceae bacterium]
MIFAIATFLANSFNLTDFEAVKKWVRRGLYAVAGLIGLIVIIVVFKSCGKTVPKLDEAEVQRGEKAVKQENDEELRNILVESDVREKVAVNAAVNSKAETVNAIHESRQTWNAANRDELQAEFDRRKNQ